MKKPIRIFWAAALAATLWGCAQFAGVATLRGADAATVDQAPETSPSSTPASGPAVGAPIARTFREQPPLVPHAIDNFDEITVTDNQCLECHSPDTFAKKKAPKVGRLAPGCRQRRRCAWTATSATPAMCRRWTPSRWCPAPSSARRWRRASRRPDAAGAAGPVQAPGFLDAFKAVAARGGMLWVRMSGLHAGP
jgi:hypothetical protein